MHSRNNSIHLLRGISAILVLVHHVLSQSNVYWEFSRTYVDIGRTGVVSFFLISGFVIHRSITQRKLKDFLFLRFFRLYPIYWIALITYLAIFQIASDEAKKNITLVSDSAYNVTPFKMLLNLTMFQELFGLESILPPAWTLSIELLFYLSACLAVKFNIRNWEKLFLYFFLATFSTSVIVALTTKIKIPTSLFLLLTMAFLGAVLSKVQINEQKNPVLCKDFLISILIITIFYTFSNKDELWNPTNRILSTLLGIFSFIVIFNRKENSISKFSEWLGNISYSIYIFTPTIQLIADTAFPNIYARFVMTLLLSLILCSFTFKFIESPFLDFARKRVKN